MPPFDIDLFGAAQGPGLNAPSVPARAGAGAFGTIGAGLLDLSQLIASRGQKAGGNLQALNDQDLQRQKLALLERQIGESRAKAEHDQFMDLLKLPGPQRNAVLPSYFKKWGVDTQSDEGKAKLALWKSIGDEEAKFVQEAAAELKIPGRALAVLPVEQQVKLLSQFMIQKHKSAEDLKQKGFLPTPEGGVTGVPGFAEEMARRKGLEAEASGRIQGMTRSQAFELQAMGVDPLQATPEQKSEALRRIQARSVETAQAQAEARGRGAAKEAANIAEQRQLGKDIGTSREQLARLKQIKDTFEPGFQTWETKLGNYFLSIKEKAGAKLSPEQQMDLARYSDFRALAFQNLNLYIKEITGAQMSVPEFTRLSKSMPDPDTDSPTQFKAKMDQAIRVASRAAERYEIARKRGLTDKENFAKETGVSLFDKEGPSGAGQKPTAGSVLQKFGY